MARIEITYELQLMNASHLPVKVKILPGAYPVVISEKPAEVQSAIFNEFVQKMIKNYNLDSARLAVICHAIPEPLKIGHESMEWFYYDFKRDRDLKIGSGGANLRKMDENLVFALLERSGWAEEMLHNSKGSYVSLKTLKDGNREVYVVYNDGKQELKTSLMPSVSQQQANQIATLIANEAGLREVREEQD